MTWGKLAAALAMTAYATMPTHVHAQAAWPTKPVTVVVPFTAGGTTDLIGRNLSDALRSSGVTVIVENKPGAGTSLGLEYVTRAKPDGTTLLMTSSSSLTIYPNLAKTSYDPLTDFTPIASIAVSPVAIAATPARKIDTFKALTTFAKTNPGKLTFAVPGLGSVGHLAMADVSKQAGIEMLLVPYRGSSQALSDSLGGNVDLLVTNVDVMLPHVKSGALKPLAVLTPKRWEAWPDVPSAAELGMPTINYASNFGVYVPAGTPPELVQAIRVAVENAVASPRYKEMLANNYLQPGTGSGDELREQLKTEYYNNRRLITAENIRLQ
ncbi:Tat pathway signal sequence domain protein [Bordetella sputigena]|uniref:Bug family tripartite tricarboxylate transporter substrate binding protein n=1 Tax=Bordetella sputigena TaxID=1416810 RepID=UPI0039F0F491